ncbi:HAD-IIB family hydrolase [Chengkuizengella axinellae]|uniref:HAD-IIB family hydrolase n=1 Tax=Chengkuizengella axinellae TaxID=3064388 RepID=A0ABT9J1P3_9BACL|nr:HAD-IIB family hydrolase [Chengkuizengella sp. 2205SS18-9]MDP5275493.1 HAD-IIB family hydrolase [Chengkuizengella sp. 2205SS18-9]
MKGVKIERKRKMERSKRNALYISGLDGTLLNNKSQLSEYACYELNKLIQNGLLFTIATARSIFSIQHIFQGLSLKLPIIEFGGAFITDLQTGYHHKILDIEASTSESLYYLLTQNSVSPLVTSFNGTEDSLYYENISNEGVNWYIINREREKDMRLRRSQIKKVLNEQVICFTVIDRYTRLKELSEKILDKYSNELLIHLKENPFSKGWFWLTILDKKATREHAIRWLMNELGVDSKELTIFGSKTSDLDTFKMSKNRIAVSNANPKLKEFATEIIGTNDEDGVVKYIKEHERDL